MRVGQVPPGVPQPPDHPPAQLQRRARQDPHSHPDTDAPQAVPGHGLARSFHANAEDGYGAGGAHRSVRRLGFWDGLGVEFVCGIIGEDVFTLAVVVEHVLG